LHAARAYREAGYKASSENVARVEAHRLLTRPHVAALVREALADRSRRMHLDQDYVLTRLRMEAEYDGPGSSPGARGRACELLGKHLGMFPEKHEVRGTVEHRHSAEGMSYEERLKRVLELEALAKRRRLGLPDAGGAGGAVEIVAAADHPGG